VARLAAAPRRGVQRRGGLPAAQRASRQKLLPKANADRWGL
jgi:hypothetical protein